MPMTNARYDELMQKLEDGLENTPIPLPGWKQLVCKILKMIPADELADFIERWCSEKV